MLGNIIVSKIHNQSWVPQGMTDFYFHLGIDETTGSIYLIF